MKTNKYRFELGHLYEYSDPNNAYLHVYHRAGASKKESIQEYQELLRNDSPETNPDYCDPDFID